MISLIIYQLYSTIKKPSQNFLSVCSITDNFNCNLKQIGLIMELNTVSNGAQRKGKNYNRILCDLSKSCMYSRCYIK